MGQLDCLLHNHGLLRSSILTVSLLIGFPVFVEGSFYNGLLSKPAIMRTPDLSLSSPSFFSFFFKYQHSKCLLLTQTEISTILLQQTHSCMQCIFLLRHVFVLSQPAGASNSKALPLVLSRTSFSLLHTTLLNTIVTVEIQYIELEHVEHGTCTLLFFQQCLALIPYSKCGNTVPLWSACSFFFLLLYYAIPLLATLTMTSRYCTVLVTVRYYRPV